MTRLPDQDAPRIAFVGASSFEPHVPRNAKWGDVRLFVTGSRGTSAALAEAGRWKPDWCFLFDPLEFSGEPLAALEATKIGVLVSPRVSVAEQRRLRALETFGGLRGFTCLEEENLRLAGLTMLQTLPLPVDRSLFENGPSLDAWSLLTPAWARPPRKEMDRLAELGPISVVSPAQRGPGLIHLLRSAGVLLYESPGPAGRSDPLPLLALAAGLLVVTNAGFPPAWEMEPWDDFVLLDRSSWFARIEDVLRRPEVYKGVRLRAWQKVREHFCASNCFERLVEDLELLDPAAEAQPRKALAGRPKRPVPRKAAGGEL